MVAMKKIIISYATAVAAAVFAVSCVNGQVEPMEEPSVGEVEGIEFVAHSEPVLKSALNGLAPVWVSGDEITVFGEDGTGVTCTYIGDNTFKGKVITSDKYYAVYPASSENILNTGILTAEIPAEQTLMEGQNVAPGALVSFAVSEDENLYFRNATGLVKLNIGRSDIASVQVSSSVEGECLAGKFTVDPSAEEPSIALVDETGVSTITLLPSGSTFEPGEYYITTLPVTVSGVKVTFTNTKSATASITKSSNTLIERSSGIDLGQFFTYEIGTPEDLLAWNKANSKWTAWDVVKLTDNIDMSSIDDQWVIREFSGVFDGNGKTLSNATLGDASVANVGLFNPMNGTVKNLTVDGFAVISSGAGAVISGNKMFGNVEGCTIKNSTVNCSGDYASIIAARTGGSNKPFNDCVVQKCTLNVTKSNVGAICGRSESTNLTISGCEVTETVISAKGTVGGILGFCEGSGSISDCVVSKSKITSSTSVTGGVVGLLQNASGTIDGCISRVNTISSGSGQSYTGGIVGHINPGCAINNISEGNTITSGKSIAGGIAGYLTGGHAINNISKDCLVSTENSGVNDQFVGLIIGADNGACLCKNNIVVSGNVKYGANATKYVGIIAGKQVTGTDYTYNYYATTIITGGDLTNNDNNIGPMGKPGLAAGDLKLGGSIPIGEGYTPALSDLHTTLNANIDEGLSSTYPSIRKWQATVGGWPTFVTE